MPARRGSKGIPGKNYKNLIGKPLLEITLEFATSNVPGELVVTTDCEDCVEISKKFPQAKIHDRSPELADDETPMSSVLRDVLSRKHVIDCSSLILLQPTSPFRSKELVDQALQKFYSDDFSSICSVELIDENHPSRLLKIDNHILKPWQGETFEIQRQQTHSLPAYRRTGAIYIFDPNLIMSDEKDVYGPRPSCIIHQGVETVSIDTQLDLEIAKYFFNK